ncbi:MAG: alpha/beta fold hydrolase [Lentisphaerae bacterium]|nr:alpha/beta fold hydrolase [Lentisphaerota bacterium]
MDLRHLRQFLWVFLVIGLLSSCTTSPPVADEVAELTETEAASAKLTAIESRIPDKPKPEIRNEWQNLRLYLAKARFLLERYKPSDLVLKAVAKELALAEDSLAVVESGRPGHILPGEREEAYLAENDISVQPFLRYLPPHAKYGKPMPLLVYLHGYSPMLNIVNWADFPDNLVSFAEEYGFCAVAPFGRGNTDFQGIGEQDVLRVIEEMKRRYAIDNSRIILIGFSMGGMGAWTIAAHYPDMFAGLVIISARGDYYFWHGLKKEDLPIYKQILIDTEFGHSLAANLAHIPIYCVHGTDDALISVKEARHMAETVQRMNPNIVYLELDGQSHWINNELFDMSDFKEWLRSRQKETPCNFTYTSYHPRYNSCYWIRVRRFARKTLPATISANVANGRIVVSATGVHELDISEALIPDQIKNLPIMKNGDFKIAYCNVFDHTRYANVPHGPVKEAFLNPFLFVFTGNYEDPKTLSKFRRVVFEWYRYAKAYPQMIHEKRVSITKLQDNNVFIFGEPEESELMRAVFTNSPVKATENEFVVGNMVFPRAGNGLYLVRPSPWNPSKLAVVQCGIPWGEGLPENHIYDFLPDYIVYTQNRDADGANTALCAGIFDENWQITAELSTVMK